MCNVMLWVEFPWLGGLRLHYMHYLKDRLANYPICYLSMQDIASLSGWNGKINFFLYCEENGTASPERMHLEYFGGHSRSLGDIRLHFEAYKKVLRP